MRARLLLALATGLAALALAASAHDGPHDGDAEAAHAVEAEAAHAVEAEAAGASGTSGTASPADADAAARAELAAAKQRVDRAEAAHTRMLTRNFPRGGARAEIEKERAEARSEWIRLSAARPDLAKQLEAGGPAN